MLMFGRIQQLLEGGGELFRAEAELASQKLKGLLVRSAILAWGAVFVFLGVGVALAGLTIRIAEVWGWSLALGAAGSALAVVGIALWIAAAARSAKDGKSQVSVTQESAPESPKQDAKEAKDKMKDAVSPGDSKPGTEGDSLTDELEHVKQSAIDIATRNPVAVGSAALLVLSLFGPGRTIRMISQAVAAAGLASSAIDAIATAADAGDAKSKAVPEPDPRSRSHEPRPRTELRRPLAPPRNGRRA